MIESSEISLPVVQERELPDDFTNHERNHVAFLLAFCATARQANNVSVYEVLHREFPRETLLLSLRLARLYRESNGNDSLPLMEWERRAIDFAQEISSRIEE